MKFSLLDRAIAAFSPQAGLQRALARQAIDAVAGATRGYDGAKTGRRTDGWMAAGTSANAEIGPAMDRLRARARDLVRNNPWGERSAQIWRAYLVGAGIIARPTVAGPDGAADKAATARLRGEFDRWAEQCDADGVTDWYGLQSQIAESLPVDGEVLLRRRWRWKADGMRVPFQLQLLEADFLDGGKSEALKDGGWILQGKQYDARGRLTGFWLFPSHPGDLLPGVQKGYTSRFVPAEDVLHIFEPRRPGQVRGASWYAPIVMKLRDIDDYDDFEIVRKKVEATMAAFVTRQANASSPLSQATTDADGKRIETYRPATVHYLAAGDDVKFNEPTGSGGYAEYMRVGAQRLAAGIGMPYELLTGDLGNVNYSSMRGGMLPFKRIIQRRQWQVLIPQLCRPVIGWWNEAAALAGIAVPEGTTWRQTPPRFEYVNPLDDVQADKMAIRAGLEPFDEIVASNGWDAEELVENMARWNGLFDRHGLTLDIDPRRISNSGVVQSAAKGAPANPKE